MRYFDRKIVEQSLSPALCLQLSCEAFALVSQGNVEQPLRSIIASADGRMMGTMPALIKAGSYAGFGLKTVKVDFSHADQRPSHEGSILLYDALPDGGMAAVDAGAVTEMRTAAASALATQLLSPPHASHLAILGSGVQAKKHVQMLLAVRPVDQITVWGRSGAADFAAWCRDYSRLPVNVAATPAEAVREAEIICTVTAAKDAFLYQRDLPAKCHINAVGASAKGFQELAADVYSNVQLYVDSREAVWNASTCLIQAREKGLIDWENQGTEIGELAQSVSAASPSPEKSTLFKSVGIAVQDLVFARAIVNMNCA